MTSPGLFVGLVDDAAVFPPGNAPLPEAVARHAVHRTAWYAALVGPLLVPVGALGGLGVLVRDQAPDTTQPRLRVGAVARPGTGLADIVGGLDALDEARVEVVGLEMAWAEGWREGPLTGSRLVLEVPRGEQHDAALADIRMAVREGYDVVAKFRTGATPTWVWPDETELAAFIVLATALEVPFKLTGGLHHAVRGRYAPTGGEAEENHGLLNVLLATQEAESRRSRADVAEVLADRDAQGLVSRVRGLTVDDAVRVRVAFTAYGCCGVTDPITELAGLGLLEGISP